MSQYQWYCRQQGWAPLVSGVVGVHYRDSVQSVLCTYVQSIPHIWQLIVSVHGDSCLWLTQKLYVTVNDRKVPHFRFCGTVMKTRGNNCQARKIFIRAAHGVVECDLDNTFCHFPILVELLRTAPCSSCQEVDFPDYTKKIFYYLHLSKRYLK